MYLLFNLWEEFENYWCFEKYLHVSDKWLPGVQNMTFLVSTLKQQRQETTVKIG